MPSPRFGCNLLSEIQIVWWALAYDTRIIETLRKKLMTGYGTIEELHSLPLRKIVKYNCQFFKFAMNWNNTL
jgi:hypothetical protein